LNHALILADLLGPIVRITPDEVHLSDPDNYDIINHVGTKYAKDPQFYGAFGIGYSSFSSIPNNVHRVRRGALNTLFSRKRVLELEDVVQIRAQKLAALVEKNSRRVKPSIFTMAFALYRLMSLRTTALIILIIS
jgi:cytochrome P450